MAPVVKRTRLGQSKYPYRDEEEQEQIVTLLAKGKTNEEVSQLSGWSLEQIRDTRAAFFPTVGLATHYLRSNALRLAKRVVEEANVEESMDILSRPNIGVLKAAEKAGGSQGPTAILTSINPSHLGGVQVAVVMGATQRALPEPSEGETHGWTRSTTEVIAAPDPLQRAPGQSPHPTAPLTIAGGTDQRPRRHAAPRRQAQRPQAHGRHRPPVSPQGRRKRDARSPRRHAHAARRQSPTITKKRR